MEGRVNMKDKLNEQKELFLKYIGKKRGLSGHTSLAYENDIEKFFRFLRKKGIKDATDISDKVAYEYYKEMAKSHEDRTVMRNLSSLRKFYDFLADKGIFKKENPFEKIRHKPKNKKAPEILSVREISRFFRSLNGGDFLESRDRAIVLFIYATGLRASEIAEAKIDRLDLNEGKYTLGRGKNKKTIYFGKKIVPELEEYLYFRKKLLNKLGIKGTQNKHLFLNIRGNRITRQTAYIVVQKRARMAGLSKNVTPAVLRNSLAAHLLGSGTSEEVVKETLRYTTLLPKFDKIPNTTRTRFEYLTAHPSFKKR